MRAFRHDYKNLLAGLSQQAGEGELEGLRRTLEYFVKEYHAVSFTAATALENTPSCRLLERLGFSHISSETVSFDGKFLFQSGNFALKFE